jgi:hypothetical protein
MFKCSCGADLMEDFEVWYRKCRACSRRWWVEEFQPLLQDDFDETGPWEAPPPGPTPLGVFRVAKPAGRAPG